MKTTFLKTFEVLMAAAAFAEEGESETAREFLCEEERNDREERKDLRTAETPQISW